MMMNEDNDSDDLKGVTTQGVTLSSCSARLDLNFFQ